MVELKIEVDPLGNGGYGVFLLSAGHRRYFMGTLVRQAQGSWWACPTLGRASHHGSRPEALQHLQDAMQQNHRRTA